MGEESYKAGLRAYDASELRLIAQRLAPSLIRQTGLELPGVAERRMDQPLEERIPNDPGDHILLQMFFNEDSNHDGTHLAFEYDSEKGKYLFRNDLSTDGLI